MSFFFGFSSDDIDGSDDENALSESVQKIVLDVAPLIQPKRHAFTELLSSLPDQVSYSVVDITASSDESAHSLPTNHDGSSSKISVLKRSVFDIRTQLMAEANPEENESDGLLAGLENGDLNSGIYEGGFKTWECALDLASVLVQYEFKSNLHVVELGAGSALPSLVLLARLLSQPDSTPFDRIKFTLCDYNEDVLRVCTVPNVFLTQQARSQLMTTHSDKDEQFMEGIDEKLVQSAARAYELSSISFDFISGAWGDAFVDMLKSDPGDRKMQEPELLILASETIYSPSATREFVHTIIQLLKGSPSGKALVAAKKVYFGVGGSIDDFSAQVLAQGGSVKTVLETKNSGVGRVVLEVQLDSVGTRI